MCLFNSFFNSPSKNFHFTNLFCLQIKHFKPQQQKKSLLLWNGIWKGLASFIKRKFVKGPVLTNGMLSRGPNFYLQDQSVENSKKSCRLRMFNFPSLKHYIQQTPIKT